MSSRETSPHIRNPPNLGDQQVAGKQDVAETTPVLSEQGKRGTGKTHATSRTVAESSPRTDLDIGSPEGANQENNPIPQECLRKDAQDSMSGLAKKIESLTASSDPSSSSLCSVVPTSISGEDAGSINKLEGSSDGIYLDPTPKTPRQEPSPALRPQVEEEVKAEEGSTPEIQNIMDQFDEDNEEDYAVEAEEGQSPGLGTGNSHLGAQVQHPPRRSSLEPLRPTPPQPAVEPLDDSGLSAYQLNYAKSSDDSAASDSTTTATPKRTSSLPQSARFQNSDSMTPSSPSSLPKLPPPEPDPEPDLPFDFHRFLEQLRHRTADPVAKFLRSFLIEFGKKQWMVHEQVKIINDFLTFITNKMAQCEVWRGVSDAEFDNAKEGMEKLVMNRLYSQTFSPAIPAPAPIQGVKGKRKNTEKQLGPGRRGQHQEDIERDEILGQKVRIYGWVQEEHLDIPPVGESGRRFLVLAQQELLKIKTYRAPRDKIICVLNCCKVIFGFLRNSKQSDTSADSFVPLLIYVVLHANPDHLVSNVQYILRFRNQEKLGGEAGYYLSSLMGAIQFIENLDRTSLSISDEEFEKNVEAAVSVIAERHKEEMPSSQPPTPRNPTHPQLSEKSGLSQPEVTPRNSIEAEYSNPRRSTSSRDTSGPSLGSDGSDDSTAVGGLLRTIQKPLSSIGRMFSDEPPNVPPKPQSGPLPPPPNQPRLSPAVFQPPRNSNEARPSDEASRSAAKLNPERRLSAEDAAARQASAEAAEAQRIQRAEHRTVVETLAGMFPDLDKDVIDDVVRVKQGR